MNEKLATLERRWHSAMKGLHNWFQPYGQWLDDVLYLRYWFPHVPLALAVIGLGIFKWLTGSPILLHLLDWRAGAADELNLSPSMLLNGMLVLMGAGLWLRSRVVWLAVVFLLVVDLVLAIIGGEGITYSRALYDTIVIVALLLAMDFFNRRGALGGWLFAIVSFLTLMSYAVFGSYKLGEQFEPPITNLVTALYFSIVTMATVGYGDITPQTLQAKLFVVSLIVVGVTIITASLSAILVPILNRRISTLLTRQPSRIMHTNHYIIIGDSALAQSTGQALFKRNERVVYIQRQPDQALKPNENSEVIQGDGRNADVLRKAGAEKAKAVLALSRDDSENAFVVLAMHDLNADTKTVALVNDASNLDSVKRVKPALIIAPQILGGKLLAMRLNDEEIQSEDFLDQLLITD
ncbi:MAG TPA: NAD-binding protein [Gammaproteobacteria bacterium]|nr:NAD-binding protein [Gammaproteobacteria bacterium]